MSVVYFIFTLGVIVLVHELGHFVAAKSFNVYVKEFAIGMGPKVFSRKGKETTYSLRLLPIGGFVSMLGEEGVEEEGIDHSRSVKSVPKYQQIIIMLAGVVMNFLLAFLLITATYIINPVVVIPPPAIIDTVITDSPAAAAGMLSKDEIILVTFKDQSSFVPKDFYDLASRIGLNQEEVAFKIKRGSQVLTLMITPQVLDDGKIQFGFTALPSTSRKITVFEGIGYGFSSVVTMTSQLGELVGMMFKGKGIDNLSGPVGIFQATTTYAEAGLIPFLFMIGFLSINIGFMNLLPLPILDGGRVVLVLISALIRKPINQKIEIGLMLASVGLLVLLMLVASYNDILRIFT
jgi:regulator of sigma E protease